MSFAFYVWTENAFDGLHSVIRLQEETTVWLRFGFDRSSVASFTALWFDGEYILVIHRLYVFHFEHARVTSERNARSGVNGLRLSPMQLGKCREIDFGFRFHADLYAYL
jgi:hypothetical protein